MYQSCWTAVVRLGSSDLVLRARRVSREPLTASILAWSDLCRQMSVLDIEARINTTAVSVTGSTMKLSHRVAAEMSSQQKLVDDADRQEVEKLESGDIRLPGLERSYDLPDGILDVLEEKPHGK